MPNPYLSIGVIVFILAVFIFFAIGHLSRVWRQFRLRKQYELDLELLKNRWQTIEQKLSSAAGDDYRIIVIDAQSFLDDVLKEMQFVGENFNRRISLAQHKYPQLKRVRWVQRLRNKVVHQNQIVNRKQAKAALRDYRIVLKSMGLLGNKN